MSIMLCGLRLTWHNKVNCRAAAREGGLGRSVSEIISDLSIRYQYKEKVPCFVKSLSLKSITAPRPG